MSDPTGERGRSIGAGGLVGALPKAPPGVAIAGGVVLVAGVAIFGSTTGIDLPGRLPKLCVLACQSLEHAQNSADEAQMELYQGWFDAIGRTVDRRPDDLVVIFREMDREKRADLVWKRTSQAQYTRQIQYSGLGVSFFEAQGLPGKKRAMFPVFVHVPGGVGAKQPHIPYMTIAPECRALFTPDRGGPFHWDVNCGGPANTPSILGEYGWALFNPPLRNPAYSGPE
jgi:hypothetical protein